MSKAKYKFINKNVIPRPFHNRILRFNKPVNIELDLTEKDKDYLNTHGVVYEKVNSPVNVASEKALEKTEEIKAKHKIHKTKKVQEMADKVEISD